MKKTLLLFTAICLGISWILHGGNTSSSLKNTYTKEQLFEAIVQENITQVAFLLHKGVDVNACNECGATFLHAAVYRDQLEILQLLLSKGADVNAQDYLVKSTPLHRAIEFDAQDIVTLLLASGADVTIQDALGGTPLHWAVKCRREALVRVLLNHTSIYCFIKDKQRHTDLEKLMSSRSITCWEDAECDKRIAEMIPLFSSAKIKY